MAALTLSGTVFAGSVIACSKRVYRQAFSVQSSQGEWKTSQIIFFFASDELDIAKDTGAK